MGSKHAEQHKLYHDRSPSRALVVAVTSGLLLGLLIGHMHHQHTQVVLVEHLYTDGTPGKEPVRTSHGFKMVVHNFAKPKQPLGINDDGFVTTSTSITSSSSGSSSSSYASESSESSESTQSSSTSSDGSTGGSTSSSSSSSSSTNSHRFFQGSGTSSSFLYSSNSETRLTADDARRISAVLKKRAEQLPGDSIHALMTGNGSPYQNIQGRIMYASMQMIMDMPGGDKIKAFTRIMHRASDDDLVEEFPTFRAYPLEPACDTWCEFPVKDRPNAVVQWLMAAEQNPDIIKGAWLLMLESDYVWMKPLELPGSAHDLAVAGLGFRFDYIDPQYPTAAKVLGEMCPECDVSKIPRSGPAPVLMRPHELALVAPDWEAYTAWIEGNDHAKDVLGWVREMYAWCAAVHKNGINIIHQAPPRSKLISQPPHDFKQGDACMLHYTWGTLYHKNGKEFWRFDKRDWTAKEHELKIPQFKLPPQLWEEGWKLQDGVPINKDLHNLMLAMLTQMNKASAGLPEVASAE